MKPFNINLFKTSNNPLINNYSIEDKKLTVLNKNNSNYEDFKHIDLDNNIVICIPETKKNTIQKNIYGSLSIISERNYTYEELKNNMNKKFYFTLFYPIKLSIPIGVKLKIERPILSELLYSNIIFKTDKIIKYDKFYIIKELEIIIIDIDRISKQKNNYTYLIENNKEIIDLNFIQIISYIKQENINNIYLIIDDEFYKNFYN